VKLLLTGASGFLGRNVLLRAPADWHIVALYARDRTFPEFVAQLNRPDVTVVQCDLQNPDDVAGVVRSQGAEWDACLYLAAKVDIPWSVRAPREDLLANTVPLLNLLDVVRVQRFVYFSSGAVYDGMTGEIAPTARPSPTLPYAISKLACERYVQFHHQRRNTIDGYLIVRFFGAYGPYEAPHKIYTRLVQAFAIEKQTRYTIYGDGTNLIDAMFVDDAVAAIVRMITGGHWNDIVNLAGGHPVTIEDLVRTVATALGQGAVTIDKQGVANEKNEFWGSVREMQEIYGFRPRVTVPEGICRLRDFLVTTHHVA